MVVVVVCTTVVDVGEIVEDALVVVCATVELCVLVGA